MKLLSDAEIKEKVSNHTPPLITGMYTSDWLSKNSPIQPCSVDLHIGRIQIPANKQKDPVLSISGSFDEYVLDTGAIVVITTTEKLNMPARIAGIGFPPSHVSIKGLLMTNPGHVDPGYEGPMQFTVINMGRQPYILRIGDPICTLLLFDLGSDVTADFRQRTQTHAGIPTSTGLRDQDVNRLGKDFVDLEGRAKTIAKTAVKNAQWTAVLLAAVVSLGIAAMSQFLPYYLGGIEESKRNYAVMEERVEFLEKRLTNLEGKGTPTEAFNSQTTQSKKAAVGSRR
jgi:dCTP deaminase